MNSRTSVLVHSAPRDRLFAFLADINNLPKWATAFCRALKTVGGEHRVVTPEGEIIFRIDADPRSGTIDMYGGPSEDRLAYWPARVVALPGGSSAFIFTNFQWPGVTDDAFVRQCDGLAHEFVNIRRFVEPD
ncbi:MAG TPA: hypothetical protein VLG66_05210 [Alphaproteobacteria bacterium]|nr:hypothetical protein [Alphaproteobacteria bacterium]